MILKIVWGASLFVFVCFCLSCSRSAQAQVPSPGNPRPSAAGSGISTEVSLPSGNPQNKENFIEDFWSGSFARAGLPDSLKEKIIANLTQGPDFVMELLTVLESDPYLYLLVDKQHSLSPDYAPEDLVELVNGSYRVSREGLMLRRAAAESLEAMARAARLEGVTLTAASTYRSYQYQVEVYDRNVRQMGQQAADRESARPGYSQHQLGLIVDFYPIDDSFSVSPASAWLQKNAALFGWSLSFPEGYEDLTGYRWESWHYRYLGRDLTAFTDKYFDGIQQYALQFILAWLEATD